MREKLKLHENILVGSLLFGLFFGAGNLIFPVELGQQSGTNGFIATIGFLLSGVGLPIVGVVASALSESESLYDMAKPVSRSYALFFTCLLYLTIGPFFAIPRTATVAFEVGVRSILGDVNLKLMLLIFSTVFFILTLFFSLKPGKIMDIIGKYMTPIFLVLISVLIIFSAVKPMGSFASATPTDKYLNNGLLVGLIDGYNTMDALAALAFAIIIISNIRKLGVNSPKAIAVETLKSGIVCIIGMSVVYAALSYMGSTSLGIMDYGENGGLILSAISNHYLGSFGKILLAGIVTVACLKTAIGLITACSQMFEKMFPNSLTYNQYAIGFTLFSFGVANLGLSNIISLSIPVLMFAYPLSITLMILSLMSPWINKNSTVYRWTIGFSFIAAIFDLLNALPDYLKNNVTESLVRYANNILPGFSLGFGWVVPTAIGLVIGLIIWQININRNISNRN